MDTVHDITGDRGEDSRKQAAAGAAADDLQVDALDDRSSPTFNQAERLIGAIKEMGGEEGAYADALSRGSSVYSRPTFSQFERLIEAVRNTTGSSGSSGAGYPFSDVAVVDGVLTVSPYKQNNYTGTDSEFKIAMGGEPGKLRDCVLKLTAGATPPTVVWPVNFHPRTDKDVDFACVADAVNVYWITEYEPGQFAVAGWQATQGGSQA